MTTDFRKVLKDKTQGKLEFTEQTTALIVFWEFGPYTTEVMDT